MTSLRDWTSGLSGSNRLRKLLFLALDTHNWEPGISKTEDLSFIRNYFSFQPSKRNSEFSRGMSYSFIQRILCCINMNCGTQSTEASGQTLIDS
jgi:hypothetical protein